MFETYAKHDAYHLSIAKDRRGQYELSYVVSLIVPLHNFFKDQTFYNYSRCPQEL